MIQQILKSRQMVTKVIISNIEWFVDFVEFLSYDDSTSNVVAGNI